MKPNIDISENHLREISDALNILLADEYVLYTKTRNAHWNVQAANFMELHKLFESQYQELETVIDEVAERVRSLGQLALGTLRDFLKVTNLDEDSGDLGSAHKAFTTLVADHESIIRSIRKTIAPLAEKYDDLGTVDFVTGVLEIHEKTAWMLRSYVAEGEARTNLSVAK